MTIVAQAPEKEDQGLLASLLFKTAERDKRAFAELYRRTSAKLFGVALRILGQRQLAEDVLQEVYVKVWAQAGDFDPARASPIAWLAAIARNRAIDEARRGARAASVDLEDCSLVDAAALAIEEVPLAARHRSESLQALMRCLSRLDGERREAILLAYCRGLSREALARRYGKPTPTIKTWLRRGLSQLKVCLSQ